MGAVDSATGCGFSCNAGYMKDSSGRACNYPTPGTYVNVSGAEVSCTEISGIPNFNSWESGAATDADSCLFSCASGYTVSERICRKPKMLALGQEISRILFDTGEVEAWGLVVSTSPWRSHIKENLGLGSNIPQAIVSGSEHQCIILKNGNLNHGSLMCWGSNRARQLGVGDINQRTTPAAVGHTVLGDAGGGVPKTVKSVAAGSDHTCAILNDDTVVCWGANAAGQIGGGTLGAYKTISGTAGDPLSGGTANHIALGTSHTCAVLRTDNSVQCWGLNDYGQTGGGVPSLGVNKTATEIATGAASSCAILDDGSVVCLGNVSSPDLGGKTATKITLGAQHGCVLLSDKTVKCFGVNSDGQIGGGTSRF